MLGLLTKRNSGLESYLVFANILASRHRELSSIDVSIQRHTLVTKDIACQRAKKARSLYSEDHFIIGSKQTNVGD